MQEQSPNPWRDIPADVICDGFEDIHLAQNRQFQCTPSIECTAGGRLWAVWLSGGDTEPHIENFAVVSYSDDDGHNWIDPYLIIDHPVSQLVRVNYVTLWKDNDNQLWICWTQTAANWLMDEIKYMQAFAVCISQPDAEKPLCGVPVPMSPSLLHNKPVQLSTGEWLFATEHRMQRDISYVYATEQLGTSPVLRGIVRSPYPEKFFHEARITERKDGSLWILSRLEWGARGGMDEAFSYDKGKTWTEFRAGLASPLQGPGSRFHIRRLQSGALLLVNHNNCNARSHLAVFLSDDDGITWTAPYVIDARDGISYPDACEAQDGRIRIVYDRDRSGAEEILLVTVTEAEIRSLPNTEPIKHIIGRRGFHAKQER